jgi:N-hydroxyarylamine O-acetyltransferase
VEVDFREWGNIKLKTNLVEEQYLNLLGLSREALSYDYLQNICTAHLQTFAFENISKLIDYRDYKTNGYRVPDTETFIQNHIRYNFGGTCFTLNRNLLRLLTSLEFDCRPVMLGNQHMAILVTLPDLPTEHVYVDCGAAAPIFEPVRFETNPDNVSAFGVDEIRILRDAHEEGHYTYVRSMNGEPSGTPWVFDTQRTPAEADFEPLIEAAYQPGTTFMKMLRCQIWQLDKQRSVSLADNVFSIRRANGETERYTLASIDEIVDVIRGEFHLPNLPVQDAMDILRDLQVDIFHK